MIDESKKKPSFDDFVYSHFANFLYFFKCNFRFFFGGVHQAGFNVFAQRLNVIPFRANDVGKTVFFSVTFAQLFQSFFVFESQTGRFTIDNFLVGIKFEHRVAETGQLAHTVRIKLKDFLFL